jgi:hypothetical protein
MEPFFHVLDESCLGQCLLQWEKKKQIKNKRNPATKKCYPSRDFNPLNNGSEREYRQRGTS